MMMMPLQMGRVCFLVMNKSNFIKLILWKPGLKHDQAQAWPGTSLVYSYLCSTLRATWIYLNKHMFQLADHACIYIYYKVQATNSYLAKPYVKVLTYLWFHVGRKLPQHISRDTCSLMLKVAVHTCIYVYYKGQVNDFDLLYLTYRYQYFCDLLQAGSPPPMLKIVVCTCIYVHYMGQVTNSDLLNCAWRYWCFWNFM